MKINHKNLVYHGMFILVFSSLLTFGIAYAQEAAAATFPLGPMPKLIVFIATIVISMVVDTVIMLSLSGGPHPLNTLIMAVPWAFLNIYWFDYIAPATGMTLMTMRFVQIGDAAWNYWIGINWIVVFILDFVIAQFVFRALRGASTTPNWQDVVSAGIDVVMPAILFIVLPMLGIF